MTHGIQSNFTVFVVAVSVNSNTLRAILNQQLMDTLES